MEFRRIIFFYLVILLKVDKKEGENVLKNLKIENEKIFLDGEELPNVNAYKLESSADSQEPAKLTVTMYVNVGQVCSG